MGVPGGTKTFAAMNKLQPHPELANEELCIILVEHTDMAKIRKIFNKINKYAKEHINSLSGDGEVMLTLLASFAQEEVRNLSENVQWGTWKRFEQGIPNGRFLICGYHWEGDHLVIEPEETKIVRLIYDNFLKGLSAEATEKQLEEMGVQSMKGMHFPNSSIRAIHKNITYTGNLLFQKEYMLDPISKKTRKNHGELPQYFVENTHEAIIDPDTFEMVQREMEKRGKGRKYHSGVHTFSSKTRCGDCSRYGSKVWHSNSKYQKVIWQRNHKFDGCHHCSTPHLTDDIIQRAFLLAANKLLATKDTVIADGREMMTLLFDMTELEREQAELQQETQVVSDMVQQCIYENAHVALGQTEYQKRYDGLTDRFEKVKARLDSVTAEIHQMQTQRASIEDFLSAFAAMPDELTEFTLESWHGLVDYGTVCADDNIRFTFKNGYEVKA